MKKIIKIIAVNIAILFILLCIIDIVLINILITEPELAQEKYRYITGLTFTSDNFKDEEYLYDTHDFNNRPHSKYRSVVNINSNKRPIVVFGCSFAFGHWLRNNETFSYQLGKLTKRPVYNRAKIGHSPREMLYQLKKEEFYDIVPKNKTNPPEYVIYVLIKHHILRVKKDQPIFQNRYTVMYKPNKNRKEGEDYLLRDRFQEIITGNPIYYVIKRYIYDIERYDIENKDIDFLKAFFRDAKKETDRHWGNDVKFVILLYGSRQDIDSIKQSMLKLDKEGFIVLDANELAGVDLYKTEYQISEQDKHPNAKAWEILTPKLVEKLGIE